MNALRISLSFTDRLVSIIQQMAALKGSRSRCDTSAIAELGGVILATIVLNYRARN